MKFSKYILNILNEMILKQNIQLIQIISKEENLDFNKLKSIVNNLSSSR